MTIGKTIALTRWTFVGKVLSLLFNILSRLVITFLPRSKRLLISWLQSPSAGETILQTSIITYVHMYIHINIVQQPLQHIAKSEEYVFQIYRIRNYISVNHSVVPDSLWSHGLQSTRLLCPWDFPGKDTGEGCHFLIQGVFLLHCRQILYQLSYKGSPKELHYLETIRMTRISLLEGWGAIQILCQVNSYYWEMLFIKFQ